MPTLALYGFASATREGIWQTKADQIWSIGWAYKYELPRIDLLLEMHPIWMQARSQKPEYVKAREHWEWLKANQAIPVYMLINHPLVPRCIRYPIAEVQGLVPPQRQKAVFTSSFDYLMGLAILMGYDRIELYGFEMGSETEYRYQREGAAYWIAQCDARGIELIQPSNSKLLLKRMYGYEGGSMIYRQDLERMRVTRTQQKKDAFALLSMLQGQMDQVVKAYGAEDPRAKEIANKWDEQYRICLVTSGALQECEYYLKEIDLEEPSEELEDPMAFVEMKR